jgi:hypothetical protein
MQATIHAAGVFRMVVWRFSATRASDRSQSLHRIVQARLLTTGCTLTLRRNTPMNHTDEPQIELLALRPGKSRSGSTGSRWSNVYQSQGRTLEIVLRG